MRRLSVTRHPEKRQAARPVVGVAGLAILVLVLSFAAIQIAGAIRPDPPTSAAVPSPAAVPTPPTQSTHTTQPAQPPPVLRAMDSDNPIADPAWFVQAYEAGFRLYILSSTEFGTCTPLARTQAQLAMALDAGLAVAAYTRDPRCWREGIAATGSFRIRLQFFALDIESGGPRLTREMITGVQSSGVRPVIYTGALMWDDIMGAATTEFADVALWDAAPVPPGLAAVPGLPDDPADLLSPEPIAFGGWNSGGNLRVGVQQHFERVFNGVNIDVNTFAASFLY